MSKLILIVLLFTSTVLSAQENKQALDLLQQAIKTYQQTGPFSYAIDYYYAEEKQPGKYLDSLSGLFKTFGKKSWYQLDNTEVITDSLYAITLFKDDEIMYLSRIQEQHLMLNPVAQLDSLLQKDNRIHCSIQSSDNENVITLSLNNGNYKQIQYTMQATSNLFSRIDITVKATELYDAIAKPLIENKDEYAVVTMLFSNYRNDNIDLSLFNHTRYFKKDDTGFTPLAPYQSYKIFLGSNNL